MSKDTGGPAHDDRAARRSDQIAQAPSSAQQNAPQTAIACAPETAAAAVLAGAAAHGRRWVLRNAVALLPMQRALGNQTVSRLLERPSSGPFIQRVYLRAPLVEIAQMRRDFTGYDQLQETIRKYQVAARKGSDAGTLLTMLTAVRERMRGLPKILDRELHKNYTTLLEEVTAEESRLTAAQPQVETIPSQTAQVHPTPTQTTQTQMQAPTQTPKQTQTAPSQGTGAPTEATGAPNLIVTGPEISRLLANVIGISVERLTQERTTGGSLAQIAAAHQRPPKDVALRLHELLHRLVDKRVQEGVASEAAGDQAKNTMNLNWVAQLLSKGAKAGQPTLTATPEPETVVSSNSPGETSPRGPAKITPPMKESLVSSSTNRVTPTRVPTKPQEPTAEAPVSNITANATPRAAVVTNAPRKEMPVSTITSFGGPMSAGGTARQAQVESAPSKVELNTPINEPTRTKSTEPWASDPAGYLERTFKIMIVTQKSDPADESIRPGRTTGRKEWRSDELALIAATLSKLGNDTKALEGVGLERVDSLPPVPGSASKNRVDAGRFAYVVGTPGIKGNRFYMSDRAFRDLESTHGSPSDTVDTIVHEVGHAIEMDAARRASWVANELTDKLISAKAEEDAVDQKTEAKALEFDQARAAFEAKGGTNDDKKRAILLQGQYEVLAAELTQLEKARKLAREESNRSQLELEQVYDVKLGKSRCLLNFEKFVRSQSIKPTLTDYAAENWPARPQEFYAEAYMVWINDKGKLKAHSQPLYDYFASGQYRSST